MADTGIFCDRTQVERKAGADVSSTATEEAYTNDFIAQAESFINCACRYNFSDTFADLNDDVKKILSQVASDLAAIYVIQYNMSSMDRIEGEDRINILRDSALRGISILRDKKTQEFINGA
jgi:hypothetical protein